MLNYTLIALMTQKIKNPLFGLESLFSYTAGLQLLGTEVKSIKTGQGSLRGASCVVRGGEVFLLGANIPAYQNKNTAKVTTQPEQENFCSTKKKKSKTSKTYNKPNKDIFMVGCCFWCFDFYIF